MSSAVTTVRVMRSAAIGGGVLIALLLLMLTVGTSAKAASPRIDTGSAIVSASGRVAIPLQNRSSRSVSGTLTLRTGKAVIGSARFRVAAQSRRPVRLWLTVNGARRLARSGRLAVTAVVRARGSRATRRKVKLKQASTRPGVPKPAGPTGIDGRYHGHYAEANADLAFYISNQRLYTGPFDAFYVEAICRNVQPDYTGPDQVYPSPRAIEPVEVPIAADGTFKGEGSLLAGSGTLPIRWTITGRVTGSREVHGEVTAAFTDPYGNPCQGTTRFTARYYGRVYPR